MLKEVVGNLILDEQYKIFCHQTNCKGVMGSGIAKQIANMFPAVQMRNKDYCKRQNILGTFLAVRVSPTRICVNLYGQDGYGRQGCYTDYDALKQALDKLAVALEKVPQEWTIGFPYRMSCGLGGGAWGKVYLLITEFANKVKQDVYIVKLKGVHDGENKQETQRTYYRV